MTVNLNLSGLPAVVLPCGFAPPGGERGAPLPIGLQLVGRMFGEAELLRLAHVYEQTAGVSGSRHPQVAAAEQQLVAAA